MIIGVSGPAGSGKDTCAEYLVYNHGFVRIALADKLKRICQEVFSFTDEQLWGPSSKRNEPDKRYPRAHSYDGDVACTECGVLIEEALELDVPCYLTPRYALQQLGTEWGRDCYGPIWIKEGIQTAQTLLRNKELEVGEPAVGYSPRLGLHRVGRYVGSVPYAALGEVTEDDLPEGVVISDVRFKNEIEYVKEAGGKLIRLKRTTSLGGSAKQHISETEMLGIPDELFDVVINNTNISLKELEEQVSKAYHSLC